VSRISFFHGIAVYVYFGDHNPPHVHIWYGGYRARVEIATGTLLSGSLPHVRLRLVRRWLDLLSADVHACWEARDGGTIARRRGRAPLMADYDVISVEIVGRRSLRLGFADGTERTVDLAPFLNLPIMRRVRDDDEYFAAVRIDPECLTIVWPNGENLAPDTLHGDGIPAFLEESSSAP
jgi:hypothetical protein